MEVLEGRGAFMKSERLGHSSPSSSKGDGLSRPNDDSAVVSLKALVAKADAKATANRAPSTEDSGLIDLKSLLASAPPPSSDALPAVLQPPAAGLFDVPEATLNPYVAAAPGLARETPAPGTSRAAKWFVAASALALAVVGTIGVFHARTDQVVATQTSSVASPASPAIDPGAPSEAAKPVEAAVPIEPKAPEVANALPEATPQPVATQPRINRQTTANSTTRDNTRREQASTTAKPKAAEAASAAGTCDLMCEMKRTVTKKKAQ